MIRLRSKSLLVLGATVAAWLPGAALATPHDYPNVPLSPFVSPPPTVWYVQIPAGHMVPSGGGQALVITDAIFSISTGLYCQDLNTDGTCGGPGEPATLFCLAVGLGAGVNWHPAFDVWVFPTPGPILTGSCPGGALFGQVIHL